MKKNEFGTYRRAFLDIADLIKRKSFDYIKLSKIDNENLTLTFIVYHEAIYSDKKVNQVYIDGTFKTKFMCKVVNYNVLVFAKNLPTSLKTVPIAFTISFDGTNERYLDSYGSLEKLWDKLKVDASRLSLLSDLGNFILQI